MRLFGWFRFAVAPRKHLLRRGKHHGRFRRGWQTPGGPICAIESLEKRRLLAVTLAVSNPLPFNEGNSGTSSMVFVVTRSGDATPEVEVNYQTVNGTAIAEVDYSPASGTLDFTPGTTTLTVSVPVIGNTIFQSNRAFSLQLSELPGFAVQQTFATGTHPYSMTAADVNGDGRADLIVANESSNSVSVLLNTTAPGASTPTFAAQQTFSVGSIPKSLTVADVNGDGHPDLIVANAGSNSVSVLLNTTAPGATTPSFAGQQTFATGSNPLSVAVADLNGDGHPDLIVANYSSNSVSVLLDTTATGATTPSFAAQKTIAAGSGPRSVTPADVNGDGLVDLIVTNEQSNSVSVLLNSTTPGATTPSFAAQQTFASGSGPISVTACDLNGDGHPDLIVADAGSNSLSVLMNTTAPGAATPAFAAQQTFASGANPNSVTACDLNGDGRPDLV